MHIHYQIYRLPPTHKNLFQWKSVGSSKISGIWWMSRVSCNPENGWVMGLIPSVRGQGQARWLRLPDHPHLRCSRSCRSGSCFFHPIASRTYGAPAPAVPAVASSIPSRVAPTVLPLLPFRQLLLPSHRESHLRCSRSCRSGSRDQHDLPVHGIRNLRVL